jgi:hypothetical protein
MDADRTASCTPIALPDTYLQEACQEQNDPGCGPYDQ